MKGAEGSRVQGFEEFWKAYPRKVAKKDAQRAWKRIAPAKHDAIMAALAKQKQLPAWQAKAGLYVPYAATWLNGERWEDELPAAIAHGQADIRAKEADLLIEFCKARRPLADMTVSAREAAYKVLHALNTTWPDLRKQLLDDPVEIEKLIRLHYPSTP